MPNRIKPERHALLEVRQDEPLPSGSNVRHLHAERGAREATHTYSLRTYSLAQLVEMPREVQWLARGCWVGGSYGIIGGDLKTLKTWLALAISIGVASGTPVLGRFNVDVPGAVLYIAGEGGRIPTTARAEALARFAGVAPCELPMSFAFGAPTLSGSGEAEWLSATTDERDARLIVIDPLYLMLGGNVKASDGYQVGPVLASLQQIAEQRGASLIVVDHFNKTGVGFDLNRIAQAGKGWWADSWILLAHRHDPLPRLGQYRLRMEIGSRQWGGSAWAVDVDLGERHADALGEPIDFSATTERLEDAQAEERAAEFDALMDRIVADVAGHFPQTSARQIQERVQAQGQRVRKALAVAGQRGLLELVRPDIQDALGRTRAKDVWRCC